MSSIKLVHRMQTLLSADQHYAFQKATLPENLTEKNLVQISTDLVKSSVDQISLKKVKGKENAWIVATDQRSKWVRWLFKVTDFFYIPASRKTENIARYTLKLMHAHLEFYLKDPEKSKQIIIKLISRISETKHEKIYGSLKDLYDRFVVESSLKETKKELQEDAEFELEERKKAIQDKENELEKKSREVTEAFQARVSSAEKYARFLREHEFEKLEIQKQEHFQAIRSEAEEILLQKTNIDDLFTEGVEGYLKELQASHDTVLLFPGGSVSCHSYFLKKISVFNNLLEDIASEIMETPDLSKFQEKLPNLRYKIDIPESFGSFNQKTYHLIFNSLYANIFKSSNRHYPDSYQYIGTKELLDCYVFGKFVGDEKISDYFYNLLIANSFDKTLVREVLSHPNIDQRWQIFSYAVNIANQTTHECLLEIINFSVVPILFESIHALLRIRKENDTTKLSELVMSWVGRATYEWMNQQSYNSYTHKDELRQKKKTLLTAEFKGLALINYLHDKKTIAQVIPLLNISQLTSLLGQKNKIPYEVLKDWMSRQGEIEKEGKKLLSSFVDVNGTSLINLKLFVSEMDQNNKDANLRIKYLKDHPIEAFLPSPTIDPSSSVIRLRISCPKNFIQYEYCETAPFYALGYQWVISMFKKDGKIYFLLREYHISKVSNQPTKKTSAYMSLIEECKNDNISHFNEVGVYKFNGSNSSLNIKLDYDELNTTNSISINYNIKVA